MTEPVVCRTLSSTGKYAPLVTVTHAYHVKVMSLRLLEKGLSSYLPRPDPRPRRRPPPGRPWEDRFRADTNQSMTPPPHFSDSETVLPDEGTGRGGSAERQTTEHPPSLSPQPFHTESHAQQVESGNFSADINQYPRKKGAPARPTLRTLFPCQHQFINQNPQERLIFEGFFRIELLFSKRETFRKTFKHQQQ